jgi:hypothetical protein
MKPSCQDLALQVYETCFANRVSLNLEWIPRGQNEEADYLSRLSDILDTDDWGVSSNFFLNSRFKVWSLHLRLFCQRPEQESQKVLLIVLCPGDVRGRCF